MKGLVVEEGLLDGVAEFGMDFSSKGKDRVARPLEVYFVM